MFFVVYLDHGIVLVLTLSIVLSTFYVIERAPGYYLG